MIKVNRFLTKIKQNEGMRKIFLCISSYTIESLVWQKSNYKVLLLAFCRLSDSLSLSFSLCNFQTFNLSLHTLKCMSVVVFIYCCCHCYIILNANKTITQTLGLRVLSHITVNNGKYQREYIKYEDS